MEELIQSYSTHVQTRLMSSDEEIAQTANLSDFAFFIAERSIPYAFSAVIVLLKLAQVPERELHEDTDNHDYLTSFGYDTHIQPKTPHTINNLLESTQFEIRKQKQ